MNGIEITGLSKQYGNFRLGPIDFSVPAGCMVGLVGENGAGKSTLIKLILGLTKKDAGTVTVLGKDMQTDGRAAREQIGVVFDDSNFPESCTLKNVGTILKHIYATWDGVYFAQLAEKFSLPDGKRFKDYSRGMRMKLQIAVALAHRPKLLILDEATSGLDPVVRDEILDIFLDFLADDTHTILLSSHITSDLEKVADYIAFIHEGSIHLYEEKDALLDRYGILKCTAAEFEQLDSALIKGYRKNRFGVEALVEKAHFHGNYLIDPASIDDVMLFTLKGEKR